MLKILNAFVLTMKCRSLVIFTKVSTVSRAREMTIDVLQATSYLKGSSSTFWL